MIDDANWSPLQWHWHAPSEHTIDGAQQDAEIHFVHQNEAGEYAVFGVFFNVDPDFTEDSFSRGEQFVQQLKNSYDSRDDDSFGSFPGWVLPSDSVFWRYDGSFTTPPCTEGVTWNVYGTPATISQASFDWLSEKLVANNYREVQALGERTVTVGAVLNSETMNLLEGAATVSAAVMVLAAAALF